MPVLYYAAKASPWLSLLLYESWLGGGWSCSGQAAPDLPQLSSAGGEKWVGSQGPAPKSLQAPSCGCCLL